MPQTEAQRRAAEANLRKGNPKAFSRSQGPPRDDEGPGAPPRKRQTVRARAPEPAKPKPRKTSTSATPRPPRAPADAPAPSSEGGLLSGLLDGLRHG